MIILISIVLFALNSVNSLKIDSKLGCSPIKNKCLMEFSKNIPPTQKSNQLLVKTGIKLPIWPIYGGVFAQLADWLKLSSLTDFILSKIGGRVVPLPLNDMAIDPFLLIVHHSHSFMPLDPIRYLTKLFLPEGFPAHPHSGFGTLTFTLNGGLKHRDSEGIKMKYGNGDAQWMRSGKGVIHEEMWDVSSADFEKIDIFQLWINLPSYNQFSVPDVKVIKNIEVQEAKLNDKGGLIKVLYGSMNINMNDYDAFLLGPGNDLNDTVDMGIAHLTLPPNSVYYLTAPIEFSTMLFIQSGSFKFEDGSQFNMGSLIYNKPENIQPENIPLSMRIESGERGLTCLLMAGEKRKEDIIMSGPFVSKSVSEYNEVSRVWGSVENSAFWDHKISDIEWMKHIDDLNLQSKLKSLIR